MTDEARDGSSLQMLVNCPFLTAAYYGRGFCAAGKRATEGQKSASPKRQRLSQQQLLPLWARTEGLTAKTSHEGKHGLLSPPAPLTPRRGNSAYGIVRSTVACSSLLQLTGHSKVSLRVKKK